MASLAKDQIVRTLIGGKASCPDDIAFAAAWRTRAKELKKRKALYSPDTVGSGAHKMDGRRRGRAGSTGARWRDAAADPGFPAPIHATRLLMRRVIKPERWKAGQRTQQVWLARR